MWYQVVVTITTLYQKLYQDLLELRFVEGERVVVVVAAGRDVELLEERHVLDGGFQDSFVVKHGASVAPAVGSGDPAHLQDPDGALARAGGDHGGGVDTTGEKNQLVDAIWGDL